MQPIPEFRITELFVVSWEEGTPAVSDDTVSIVPSCSDLFILGDFRASILADRRQFMHLIDCYWADDVIGDKMSTSSDIDPVVIRRVRRYQKLFHTIKLKDRLRELFQLCFIKKNGQRRYQYLVLGRDIFYCVKTTLILPKCFLKL